MISPFLFYCASAASAVTACIGAANQDAITMAYGFIAFLTFEIAYSMIWGSA